MALVGVTEAIDGVSTQSPQERQATPIAMNTMQEHQRTIRCAGDIMHLASYLAMPRGEFIRRTLVTSTRANKGWTAPLLSGSLVSERTLMAPFRTVGAEKRSI